MIDKFSDAFKEAISDPEIKGLVDELAKEDMADIRKNISLIGKIVHGTLNAVASMVDVTEQKVASTNGEKFICSAVKHGIEFMQEDMAAFLKGMVAEIEKGKGGESGNPR